MHKSDLIVVATCAVAMTVVVLMIAVGWLH